MRRRATFLDRTSAVMCVTQGALRALQMLSWLQNKIWLSHCLIANICDVTLMTLLAVPLLPEELAHPPIATC